MLLVSALWGWYRKPESVTQTVFTPAPILPAVVKVKTVYVTVKEGKVVVLDKAEALKRIKGLEAIAADPNKQITSTASIAPYKGKTSTLNVIDTNTGISQIYAKREPLPLFAIEQDRYAGVRIGSTGNVTAFAEWNFLRVGKAHLAGYGQYSTKDQGEVGIQVKIEF